VPPFLKKGSDTAKLAGEQPVGLLQCGWRTALGALVVDRKLYNYLQAISNFDAGLI